MPLTQGGSAVTKEEWTQKIRQACEDAGTYRPFFDSVIDILAGVMEARDKAQQEYEKDGSRAVVSHKNSRGGGTNMVKNPALVVIMDCNAQALAYWRDLGLTPAGLKRLNESAMREPESKDTFASVLERLGV